MIKKYVALLNQEKIQKNFIVLCHVKLIQHKKEYISQFEKGNHAVFLKFLECFFMFSGDYDYILKICVRDIQEYREFMVSKLTNLQHIASTQSSFMIKEVKNSTVIEP